MSASAALDALTVTVKAHLVASHAGRLLRIGLAYGDDPKTAAAKAVAYIERTCAPIEQHLIADIERAFLVEAQREAAEMEAARS